MLMNKLHEEKRLDDVLRVWNKYIETLKSVHPGEAVKKVYISIEASKLYTEALLKKVRELATHRITDHPLSLSPCFRMMRKRSSWLRTG